MRWLFTSCRCAFVWLFALSALTGVAQTGATQANSFKNTQDTYEKSLAENVSLQSQKAKEVTETYIKTLKALKDKEQKAGNLENLVAVNKELELMLKGDPLEILEEPDTTFEALKAARKLYDSGLQKNEKDRAEEIVRLTSFYTNAIYKIEVEHTRKGLIDEATAVNKERKAVWDRAELVWARSIMEKQAPAEAPAAAPGSVEVAVKPVERRPEPAGKDVRVRITATPVARGSDRTYYSKTRQLTYSVEVKLNVFDVKEAPVELRVYFIGTDSEKHNVVVDKQKQSFTLDASKPWRGTITSKEIREERSYYYTYGFNYERRQVGGAKLDDCIMQVWYGDKLAGTWVSSSAKLDKLKSLPDVAKTLGELVDEESSSSGVRIFRN